MYMGMRTGGRGLAEVYGCVQQEVLLDAAVQLILDWIKPADHSSSADRETQKLAISFMKRPTNERPLAKNASRR
jgi:hypothetical protein